VTSYADSVLQSNEKVIIVGRLHWIVYARSIFFLVVGFIFLFVFTDEWQIIGVLAILELCNSYPHGLTDGSQNLQ
jgi:hypothetical protein